MNRPLPARRAFDPFSVMLFKALQVVAFLPRAPRDIARGKNGKIDLEGRTHRHHGLARQPPRRSDLSVQDPAGNIAWNRHREAGFLVLDRDDRGGADDFIVVNGKKIAPPIREDIVTSAASSPANTPSTSAHFLATTGSPVPAKVKVQKLNPTAQVIFDDTVVCRPHRRRENRRALHP